jgi:hypothetical protein
MQALMESHLLDGYTIVQEELVDKIARFLMLRQGKLVDDFRSTDRQICLWVERLADRAFLAANQEKMLHSIDEMISKRDILKPDERVASEFIRGLLSIDMDEETIEIALEILEAGYLEEDPQLPCNGIQRLDAVHHDRRHGRDGGTRQARAAR